MRVVVVDDQTDIADLITMQLEYAGHEVAATLYSMSEVQSFEGWEGVDAATLDWLMPSSSGVHIARWLAEHHPKVRTVIVTAAPASMRLDHPEFEGVVLAKPYDITDLIAALQGERE